MKVAQILESSIKLDWNQCADWAKQHQQQRDMIFDMIANGKTKDARSLIQQLDPSLDKQALRDITGWYYAELYA